MKNKKKKLVKSTYPYGGDIQDTPARSSDNTLFPINPLTGKPFNMDDNSIIGNSLFNYTPNPNPGYINPLQAADLQRITPQQYNPNGSPTETMNDNSIGNTSSKTNTKWLNLANMSSKFKNAEVLSTLGITTLNSILSKNNANRLQDAENRKAINKEIYAPVYNPYPTGNGSQALMKFGGSLGGDGTADSYYDGIKTQQDYDKLLNYYHIQSTLIGKQDKQAIENSNSITGIYQALMKASDKFTGTSKSSLALGKVGNSLRSGFNGVFGTHFANGGELENQGQTQVLNGGKVKQLSESTVSNPMFEFVGKTHAEGGIDIQHGKNTAEVEDKEIGWQDAAGDLNIFGKLKFPGTNKTFKAVAKDLALQEDKMTKNKAKALNIINNVDPDDKRFGIAANTAKVMYQSHDNQLKEIASQKESLADFQNLLLSMHEQRTEKKAFGGELNPEDPASVQKVIDKYSHGKSPLRAEDFIEVSKKYGVPLDLMLAQGINESNLGTNGRVALKTKNIFNVGNTDDGATETQNDWKGGLERYAQVIKNQYAMDPNNVSTQDILNNDFVRPKLGGRYADPIIDKNYTTEIYSLLNSINPNNGYTLPEKKKLNSNSKTSKGYVELTRTRDNPMQKFEFGGKLARGGSLELEDPEAIQKIIDKYSNGKSPLKAQDFIDVAKKYNVPIDLMLAQAIQESHIGTDGNRTKSTNNIFNVGNVDNGTNEVQKDWRSGLERYAKLIKQEYSSDPNNVNTQEILSNNFTRPKLGGQYATDPNYTRNIYSILNKINPGNGYAINSNSTTETGPNVNNKTNSENKPTSQAEGDFISNLPPTPGKGLPDAINPSLATSTYYAPAPNNNNSIYNNGATNGNNGNNDNISAEAAASVPYDYNPINNMQDDRSTLPKISPLAISQIAPELIALANNGRQTVYQKYYKPRLLQTFDTSYQVGRNDNQSQFNTAAKIAESTGNVDALSNLASQMYKANQNYNMQEVQGNATQKLAVYNQNTNTLNETDFKNLGIQDNQRTKQDQADFNTKKQFEDAFTSITTKTNQNALENKTYNAYANLFKNYGFDKSGKVTFNPGEGGRLFSSGEAQQFAQIAAKDGLDSVLASGNYKNATVSQKASDGSNVSIKYSGTEEAVRDDISTWKAIGKTPDEIDLLLKQKYPRK